MRMKHEALTLILMAISVTRGGREPFGGLPFSKCLEIGVLNATTVDAFGTSTPPLGTDRR